jgi:hypothetical protein
MKARRLPELSFQPRVRRGADDENPKARNFGCVRDVPDGMRVAQFRPVLRNRLPELGNYGATGDPGCSAEKRDGLRTASAWCRGIQSAPRANGARRYLASVQTPERCVRATGYGLERSSSNRTDQRAIGMTAQGRLLPMFYADAAAASSSAWCGLWAAITLSAISAGTKS